VAAPHAHISLVTLAVADVERCAQFYEKLGFTRKLKDGDGVAFFEAGPIVLSIYGREALANDAGLDAKDTAKYRATSMAWNCPDTGTVDAVLALAEKAGGTVIKSGHKVFWGGYIGYFEDPDGHLWEVAYNPQFPLTADGHLSLPD
jgi:predicted lactoylglutathione lyase